MSCVPLSENNERREWMQRAVLRGRFSWNTSLYLGLALASTSHQNDADPTFPRSRRSRAGVVTSWQAKDPEADLHVSHSKSKSRVNWFQRVDCTLDRLNRFVAFIFFPTYPIHIYIYMSISIYIYNICIFMFPYMPPINPRNIVLFAARH